MWENWVSKKLNNLSNVTQIIGRKTEKLQEKETFFAAQAIYQF